MNKVFFTIMIITLIFGVFIQVYMKFFRKKDKEHNCDVCTCKQKENEEKQA